MPQSLTKNCQKGMCSSVTVTISELMSYFMNIPDTPWLPAAWLITLSWKKKKTETLVSHTCYQSQKICLTRWDDKELIRVSTEQKTGEYQGHFDQYLLEVKHHELKIYFPGHWSAVLQINIHYCALVLFSQDFLTWSFKQDFYNWVGVGICEENATVLAQPVNSGECTGVMLATALPT